MRVRLIALLLPAALVLALVIASGASAAKNPSHGPPTPLIVSPRRGQAVRADHLRVVVRAGPEHEDLKARLNGVSIGQRFLVRDDERRRVLEVSPIDGLRRGKNVLRVWVLRRGGYRRATIHFDIAHDRPLASAGVDRRVIAGSRVELHGLLRLDKSDSGRKGLRWDVVKAPAMSALSRPAGSRARVTGEKSALSAAHTLTPTLRPDVRGRYKVRLTATGGNGTSVDWATVYAVPANPLIPMKTAVPATASEPQPGIQVGGETLRAPYMRTAGGQNSYAGTVEGVSYWAMWQVVTYDRVTMALKWNRTYGLCSGHANLYPCMVGPKGNPVGANLAGELAALGPETLVIASSHPSGATPALHWGPPAEDGFLSTALAGIGLPTESNPELGAQVGAAAAGEMAGVGVPGLAEGDAKFIVGADETGLNGYLTPDSNAPKHYFFTPAQRAPFDTRFAHSCNSAGCTVAQKVGETVVNGTVGAGQAGFLVSAYERHTLAPLGNQTFVTATGVNEGAAGAGAKAVAAMAAYVREYAAAERVVAITSIHGPAQSGAVLFTPGSSFQAWNELLASIALIGGTRERFNLGATTVGSDYSLVGTAPGGEGSGNEAIGAEARLRGALVPNARSEFATQGVTSGEAPPSEMLMNLLVQPPQPNAWPLEGNAEAQVAISWIGSQCAELTANPRAAYWTQLTDPEVAETALKEVQKLKQYPKGVSFSEKAFVEAREELETEIEYVRKTRVYMKELAQPANLGGKIGLQEAGLISAELEERLKDLKEEGQVNAEWLAVVEEGLEAISLGFDWKAFPNAAKFFAAAAIAAEAGQTAWSANYEGGTKPPSIGVQALQLGKQLRIQAEANEGFFTRMGDIFVSDWSKLKIVGHWGGCNPSACGEHGEYTELSHDEEQEKIASAATKRAADAEVYERLVPLAYPIWKTGLAAFGTPPKLPPAEFRCSDSSYPFEGAPASAYHLTYWQFDPETGEKFWLVYLSVARSERTYGWPSETMLKRMFESVPVNSSNSEEGGLGINPDAFMRGGAKIKEYRSGWTCTWQGDEAS
ncbi:MAG TPA: hypothetical protein VGH14_11945 [Solirubrobacterales bacterium]